MTSNKWYHRWIYQQAKREAGIPNRWKKPHLRREAGVWVAWFKREGSDEFAFHSYALCGWGATPQQALRDLSRFTEVSLGKQTAVPNFRTRRVMIPD